MISLTDKKRNAYYKRVYGITLQQYNKILKNQGGVCAVCRLPPSRIRLAVDHDHKTSELFGLLCFKCNHLLIGRIRDPSLYYNAWMYLQKGLGLFVPKKKKRRKKKK